MAVPGPALRRRARRQRAPVVPVDPAYDDLVRVYRLAIDDDGPGGPVQTLSRRSFIRQRDAARDFGAVLHRPARVPTPAPVLRAVLGEQADLLLHGQRAVSRRLNGFEFRYRGAAGRARRCTREVSAP